MTTSADRTVYADALGAAYLQWPIANVAETLDYYLDATAAFAYDLFISAAVSVQPAGELTVSSVSATSNVISFDLSGGVAGRTYTIRVDATTAVGREFSWLVSLPTNSDLTPPGIAVNPGFSTPVTWSYSGSYTVPTQPVYPGSTAGTYLLSQDRTLYVNANDVYLQWPIAEPAETLEYTVDMTSALSAENDSITDVFLSIAPSGAGELSAVYIDGNNYSFDVILTGGVPGRTYTVRADVVTAASREYSLLIDLPIDITYAIPPIPLPPSPGFGPVLPFTTTLIGLENGLGVWALENGAGYWRWG